MKILRAVFSSFIIFIVLMSLIAIEAKKEVPIGLTLMLLIVSIGYSFTKDGRRF